MDYNDFKQEISVKMSEINISLEESQIKQFYEYMNLLIEWNEKINLTAIIEPKDIILKHFVDCATISKYISENEKVLDVGTGAGFPGIPLKIIKKELQITLVDSLNKRINFLNEVIKNLKLNKIEAIHGRAEEVAKNKKYREEYDVLVSRAVAPLNILSEYTIPFVKVSGRVVCMKGNNIEEEINLSKKAIKLLGGKIKNVEEEKLPGTDIIRNIIIIEKETNTPNKYPRKAGTPKKEPL